ncbi:Dyp-type peroxidase [Streptomyces sp. DSM 40750]|uniref:Dyp-type peroxidase n=1 Tax=Streptomyces sp. DSM 40750 TaxID=2801030 RepID=UPI00214BFB9D|nr:Dyp-type peroxidase [Streptomyces sp. DSM 40750]UUU25818.1 Dyp-type peroxidase [Streptomyces sp. DSM 40750]
MYTSTAPIDPKKPTDPKNLFLREDTEIQGDVLAGFKKDHMQLVFLRFEDQQMTRTWLKQLRPLIATTGQVAKFNREFSRARQYSGGDDPKNLNALWYGISFTFDGLRFLTGNNPLPGIDNNSTDGPLKAFAEGPAKRAAALGDTGQNAPQNWLFGNFGGGNVHAVLTLAADQAHVLRATLGDVRQDLARAKIVTVYEQEGATLEGPRRGREHFGFKDGVSEPAIKYLDEPDPDKPVYEKGHPGTILINPGEFVVGLERERPHPLPYPEWAQKGSFQVVRRLAQDVPGWWAGVAEQLKVLKEAKAAPQEATTEWLAARLVGRWRSGTPVAKCPHADMSYNAEASGDNMISFRNDPEGKVTPLWSHLRKTNPRDGFKDPKTSQFVDDTRFNHRRIMRRGIPYGLPFDPSASALNGPDAPRGLVFVSYQADLFRQFEFIQRDWMNDETFPQPNADTHHKKVDPGPHPAGSDPVAGEETVVSWVRPEGNGEAVPLKFAQFVRTEGAVYAFVPSIPVIDQLAEGRMNTNMVVHGRTIFTSDSFDNTERDTVDSGTVRLFLTEDGELQVIDSKNNQIRWSADQEKPGGPKAQALFNDGELLVMWVDPDDKNKKEKVWSSGTSGHPNAQLVVQMDGNVVIYDDGKAIWHTNTAGR